MSELRGRRVVISGASSGIGLETAQMLTSQGAEVCLTARREEALSSAVAEAGELAWSWSCDVSDAASVEALAQQVASRWGSIDGLVNSAGIAPMARLDETSDEVWDECFDHGPRDGERG